MSKLLASTAPLKQYRVSGAMPEVTDIFPTISELLQKYAFRSIQETVDELSIGWVQTDDNDTAAFDNPGALHVGNFLFFAMRIDTRKVPGAVLKNECKIANAAWLAEQPNYRSVPKKKREEIKETMNLKLLAKTLPVPVVVDVVWDIELQAVYLLNGSSKLIERFEILFTKTFKDAGFALQTLFPYAHAQRIADVLGLGKELQEKNQAGTDAVMDLVKSNIWLGQDFLLWLLAGSHAGITDDIAAWVDDRLVMIGQGGEGIQKVTVVGDVHDRLPTIRAALNDGKKIVQATVYFQSDQINPEDSWKVTVSADTFIFSSFKTPPVFVERTQADEDMSEFHGAILEKTHLINKGNALFMDLFALFLRERLTGRWHERSIIISEWLAE